MHDRLLMKDMGLLHLFIGLKISQDASCIKLSQAKYGRDLLEIFHMIDCKSVNSNLVQYLLQTDIQKRTEKIQWQIQTLHRDFSPGNPNRENQHILY
jgi:hypothetical protein